MAFNTTLLSISQTDQKIGNGDLSVDWTLLTLLVNHEFDVHDLWPLGVGFGVQSTWSVFELKSLNEGGSQKG